MRKISEENINKSKIETLLVVYINHKLIATIIIVVSGHSGTISGLSKLIRFETRLQLH